MRKEVGDGVRVSANVEVLGLGFGDLVFNCSEVERVVIEIHWDLEPYLFQRLAFSTEVFGRFSSFAFKEMENFSCCS